MTNDVMAPIMARMPRRLASCSRVMREFGGWRQVAPTRLGSGCRAVDSVSGATGMAKCAARLEQRFISSHRGAFGSAQRVSFLDLLFHSAINRLVIALHFHIVREVSFTQAKPPSSSCIAVAIP